MPCLKCVFGAVALVSIVTFAGTASTFAQPEKDKKPAPATPAQPAKPGDAKPKPGAQPPANMPSPEEIKKMMDLGKPGPQHAQLAKAAGEFTTASKFRMSPEMPWSESSGTAKKTMIMDGRYLQEDAAGTMEMPGEDGKMQKVAFKGMGVYGYNGISKVYEASWVDNMGTGVMHMTGKSADNGKSIDWTGSFDDPMTGKKKTARMVGTLADDDHFMLEFFEKGEDGKEYKSMEIAYTRKGAAEKPKAPAAK